MKPTLLVLAAGMGSRYGGLKQMDGLGPNGETIIDYSIYDAVEAGFGKVVYIVREYFKEQMEEQVKAKYGNVKCVDGEPLQFEFVTQELFKIPSQFTQKDMTTFTYNQIDATTGNYVFELNVLAEAVQTANVCTVTGNVANDAIAAFDTVMD